MKLIESIASSTWVSGFKHVTCSRPDCSRWLTQRHLETRKVGVTYNAAWYCSYRCVAGALDKALSKLVRPVPPSAKHSFRMPLGLTLVSRGQLSEDQFRVANDKQKEEGREISDVLLDLGYVTEKQVTAVRAVQWACPVFEMPESIPPVAFRIPVSLMKQHRMVPIHYSARQQKLSVAFVAGIEYGPLYALEQMSGCKAQPYLMTASDYNRYMAALSEPDQLEERTFAEHQSALDIRHVICTFGAQMDAEDVAFARCGDQLWARLRRGSVASDFLFPVT